MGNVQNHSLQSFVMMGSIYGTTTYEGNRNPYLSGIFLSQIYTSQGEHRPKSIEFAVRLISRNKASNRTNKASYSYVAVETLSHPIKQGDIFYSSLTKTYETMKNPIQKPTALLAAYFPIVSTSTQGGLANA
ncbi:hypothetical protein MUW69_002087 [Rodentibacter heylii]|nr:hypothetical protein [Rodentibacter heylii]